MNNMLASNIDLELIAKALDEVHASVGIEGELLTEGASDSDATVLLTVNGKQLRYDCEVKKKIDRYALAHSLLNKLDNARHTLLVSTPLSQDMANHCRDIGLQFIDTAGNAYINDGKGIYIHVSGRRASDDWLHAPSNNTMTPALVRLMFAFLAEPALLNAPYRDMALQAKISTGSIGKALETLDARDMIGTTARGERMIRTPELFLNEWASSYTARLKPKLRKYRFATDNLARVLDFSPGLRLSALGGEPAASILTKHLTPEECTIYVDMDDAHALRDIVKEFRLRADAKGPVEIVEMFWNADYFTEWFPTVPPHLVYADLMATHDSRNIAIARQIAAQVIDHVHGTNR